MTLFKDHRIRLRDRITGNERLVPVAEAQKLMKEPLPAAMGVGTRWEQLYHHDAPVEAPPMSSPTNLKRREGP